MALAKLWPEEEAARLLSWAAFRRVDLVGSASLLGASGFLVFAIQQAGSQRLAWSSPAIIASLLLSAASGAVFAWWEVRLETRGSAASSPSSPLASFAGASTRPG